MIVAAWSVTGDKTVIADAQQERRFDRRAPSSNEQRLSIKNWLRILIHRRLGVDRRKNTNRRRQDDRRYKNPASLLTQEELMALLGD
jgi:hypothetical protein